MKMRRRLPGTALTIAVLVIGVASASTSTAAATGAKSKMAPANCRALNPLFSWQAGQERSLRAAENHCDAAPGRHSWLIFQRNGNLGFYVDGEQVWDSETRGEGRLLVERSYGGLDIVNSEGGTIWGTGAPGSESFEPHPSGGFGVGFETEEGGGTSGFTHWSEGEGLCGPEGGCGQTLWISGKGVV